MSRRDKRKLKKAAHVSLLSVENYQSLCLKNMLEVKNKWVKVRATMDCGAAGHVMLEGMLPRVKLERKTEPHKFLAANVEQITELGLRTIPFKTNEGSHSCMTFRVRCRRSFELETLWRSARLCASAATNPEFCYIGLAFFETMSGCQIGARRWLARPRVGRGYQIVRGYM